MVPSRTAGAFGLAGDAMVGIVSRSLKMRSEEAIADWRIVYF
jgi:hypothetical protein